MSVPAVKDRFAADIEAYIRNVLHRNFIPERLHDEVVRSRPEIKQALIAGGIAEPTIVHLKPALLDYAKARMTKA